MDIDKVRLLPEDLAGLVSALTDPSELDELKKLLELKGRLMREGRSKPTLEELFSVRMLDPRMKHLVLALETFDALVECFQLYGRAYQAVLDRQGTEWDEIPY